MGSAQVERPSVSGDWVVWRGFDLDLEAVDLATGQRRALVSPDGGAQPLTASLDGTRVAWLMTRPDSAGHLRAPAVEVGDLGGDRLKVWTDSPSLGGDGPPDVSGDRVVWARWVGPGTAIELYDAVTGRARALTSGGYLDQFPAIDGDRVVFDRRPVASDGADRTDIMLLDLRTGDLRKLNPHQGPRQGNPDISGHIVAWDDATDGRSNVVYRDLSTGRFVNATLDRGHVEFGPRVSGDWIVWEDDMGLEGEDIRSYDIRTGEESRVTYAPGDQLFPAVDGDRVAWIDRNGFPPRVMEVELSTGP